MDSTFDAVDREIIEMFRDKPDLNRITQAHIIDGEKFVFRYDADSADCLLQEVGKMAADKDIGFTWQDSAVVSMRLRKLQKEQRSILDRARTGI